jgi:hypothetical protein
MQVKWTRYPPDVLPLWVVLSWTCQPAEAGRTRVLLDAVRAGQHGLGARDAGVLRGVRRASPPGDGPGRSTRSGASRWPT